MCGICVCGCRHRVTLVNIKAALYLAELTNLSHPLPRAAFETHTGGVHFRSLNTILLNPSSSSCRIRIQLHVHSLLLSPHLKSVLNFIFTGRRAGGLLINWHIFHSYKDYLLLSGHLIALITGVYHETTWNQIQNHFKIFTHRFY